jgi:hypothetical protein
VGIKNISHFGVFVQVLQENAAQGGLPGPYFAGDFDEPVPVRNGILEMSNSFLVTPAQEQVLRVRNQLERPFFESEKIIIHVLSFINPESIF